MELVKPKTHILVVVCLELFVIWLIITPLVIYNTVKYYQQRNTPQLSRRHTSLVIALSISTLLYTTAGRTVGSSRKLIFEPSFGRPPKAVLYAGALLYIIPAFSLLNILFWRLFLLNFKIRYTMMIEKGEWMMHINAKSAQQSNWYDTHRCKEGSLKWMLRWFIPILCLQWAICLINSNITYWMFGRFVYYACIAGLNFIIVVSICVMYCVTPPFADIFGLRDEIKYVLIIGMVGFISFVLTAVVDVTNALPAVMHDVWIQTNEIILDCVFCGIVMISTYWTMKRFSHETILNSMSFSLLQGKKETEPTRPNLATFLSTSACVYSFMSHLCREFNSENLLFIYECSQFKELCGTEMDEFEIATEQEAGDALDANTARKRHRKIVLPKNLPRSDIVHSNGSIQDKFALLTEKYVLYSAEFQINIPYQCMQSISNKYKCRERMSATDLYSVFDDAVRVITGLMDESYLRFGRTEQYLVAMDSLRKDAQ